MKNAPVNFGELDDADLIASGQIIAALVLQVNAEFRRREAGGGKLGVIGQAAFSEPQQSPSVR